MDVSGQGEVVAVVAEFFLQYKSCAGYLAASEKMFVM